MYVMTKKKKRSLPTNQWVFGLKRKQKPKWYHPKMVTPGAGCSHPPLSDATGQTLDTPIDFAFSPRLNPCNTVVA